MNLTQIAEIRPFECPLVVIDTETTGLQPELGHRVVEIGAVRFEAGRAVAELSSLINPDRRMDPGASRVNGIQDADLHGKPRFAELMPDLLSLLDGAVLVAHNASFDAGFLGMEFFINDDGRSIQPGAPLLPNPWLCTLQLARRQFYFGRNNLGQIARALGVRTGRAHRALSDVYTTAEIFKRMVKKLEKQRLTTIGDLFLAQGGPIFTPPPPLVEVPAAIHEAIEKKRDLEIDYIGGSATLSRRITPLYSTASSTGRLPRCFLSFARRTAHISH